MVNQNIGRMQQEISLMEKSEAYPVEHENFLILSTGRSGSSLIAGIFAHHGVWVGKSHPGDQNNQKGYFENIDVKRAIHEHYGKDFLTQTREDPIFTQKLRKILPERWMVKIGALHYDVFSAFKPLYIKLWRDRGQILRSYERTGFLKNYPAEEIIDNQHKIMNSLPGIDIWTEDVVNGVYEDLIRAFDYVGVPFSHDIVDNFVDKSLYDLS